MTTQEFSDQWDTLVYQNQLDPRLVVTNPLSFDDYEKSVYLTDAQETIVKTLYRGIQGDNGFEQNEEIRSYLSTIVVDRVETESLTVKTGSDFLTSSNSYGFVLDDDVWYIVYESVDWDTESSGCLSSKGVAVVPVRHDEYHRIKNNPFRGANDRRALRLDINLNETLLRTVEIISKYPVTAYHYRFLKKPSPIIVSDLPDGLSIDGVTQEQTSTLPESLHKLILSSAVESAIADRVKQSKQSS